MIFQARGRRERTVDVGGGVHVKKLGSLGLSERWTFSCVYTVELLL
jgi:hypothetical protein